METEAKPTGAMKEQRPKPPIAAVVWKWKKIVASGAQIAADNIGPAAKAGFSSQFPNWTFGVMTP